MFGTCSGFPTPELLETHAALLRARRERPSGCHRAAKQHDEPASSYTNPQIE